MRICAECRQPWPSECICEEDDGVRFPVGDADGDEDEEGDAA